MSFKDAPKGARFKYPGNDKVFVKLESRPETSGLIVEWPGNVKVGPFQSHCCFCDESEGITFETEIELI